MLGRLAKTNLSKQQEEAAGMRVCTRAHRNHHEELSTQTKFIYAGSNRDQTSPGSIRNPELTRFTSQSLTLQQTTSSSATNREIGSAIGCLTWGSRRSVGRAGNRGRSGCRRLVGGDKERAPSRGFGVWLL
jgi:hypothetical protein